MKHIVIVLGLIAITLLVAMPVMAQGTVTVPCIQTGTFNSTGANLSSGSGDRQMSVAVNFPQGFSEKPEVMVALTGLDASDNVRVILKVEGVSRDGFTVVVKTWADSKVNSIQGTWMAVAPEKAKVKK
jgi:hypothetical protein